MTSLRELGGDDSSGDLDAPFEAGDDPFTDLLRSVAQAPAVRLDELASRDLVGRTLGRFKIVERLGAGGMGVVYGAEDPNLGRKVALKVLAPATASDARALELLLREARAAAAINHGNIAAIYEAGEADGIAFIAMEHVDGVTLRARMARERVPIEAVLRYSRQIAHGLALAHARGVVHRDLKPDNVMIDRDDQIKILDFGLARPPAIPNAPPSSAHMRAGPVVAGTPMYMSPEQARGESVDPRSDIFSFGVLLYELLTGLAPFADRGRDRQLWAFEPPTSIASLRDDTPRALSLVVERCMLARASQRYANGAALSRVLDAIEASPPRSGKDVAEGRASRDSGLRSRRSALIGVAVGVAASFVAVHAWRAKHPERAAAPAPSAARPLVRLTANIPDNPVLSAALSPDGTTLAYIDKLGVNIERVGGSPERLAFAAPGAPQIVAWFPDGGRLAVCTSLPGEEEEDLWVVPLAGGAPPRRLARGPFTALAVSPDGSRLAFGANDSLGWLPARASEPAALQRLVKKESGCFIGDVVWSPDGERIAYASLCFDSLAGTAIESVSAGGGAPTVAVAEPHLYNSFARAGVAWSHAGEIVYPRAEWLPAEAGSNLWSVPVDPRTGAPTAPPHPITSWVGVGAAALTASTSMDRIAFIRFEAQTDVYVGDLSEDHRTLTPPKRLTLTDRNERPSAWSKDGRGVYFFSDRSGNFDIFFQELGGTPHAVAASPEWETLSQLSPDGASLLYWRFPPVVSGEGVRPELARRRVADGPSGPSESILTASTLSHPAGAGRPAPWEVRMRCAKLPGTSCVLSEKVGGALVFFALDPVHGRGEELFRVAHPTAASNIWDISPDGTRLAIPRANGPILIQPIRGAGAPKELLLPGCDPVTPTWSPDGRGLFVSVDCEVNDPPFRLYYLALDGTASLLWQAPPLYILESEPSPDGKHLAIAVKHKDDDVWMIDGAATHTATALLPK